MAQARTNEILEATFSLPDTLTVRQHLAFQSAVGGERGNYLAGYWEAGKQYISDWQSDTVADPLAINLDTETNPAVARLILWCANEIAAWYYGLTNIEKN